MIGIFLRPGPPAVDGEGGKDFHVSSTIEVADQGSVLVY